MVVLVPGALVAHLSDAGLLQMDARAVDPHLDLRPVCYNCHAIIHRDGLRQLTMDQVRSMVQRTRRQRHEAAIPSHIG